MAICIFYYSFTLLVSNILFGLLSILFILNYKKKVIFFVFLGILSFGLSKLNKNCDERLIALNLTDVYKINDVQKNFYDSNFKNFESYNESCLNFINKMDRQKFKKLKTKYIDMYLMFENMKKSGNLINQKLLFQYKTVEEIKLLKTQMKDTVNELNEFLKNKPYIYEACQMNSKSSINNLNNQMNSKSSINNLNIQMNSKSSINNHNNVTVSVYINSLLVAFESLKKYPLGIGLNNYYIAHNEFTTGNLYNLENSYSRILHPEVISLNSQDGRNNLLKIVVEFGILSILFILMFLKIIYKIYKKQEIINLIFLVIITTQLLSGSGYINGGFIFSVLVLIVLNLYGKKKI